MSVLELGSGDDPDLRSTVRMDIADLPETDVVHDIEDTPWPFEDDEFRSVIANHVFEHLEYPEDALRECCRVVEPGGSVEVRVPIGLDNRIDPTHETEWTWTTPEFFASGGERDYYYDLPLELAARGVDVWFPMPLGVFNPLAPLGVWLLSLVGSLDLLSATPWLTGELTAVYQVIEQ